MTSCTKCGTQTNNPAIQGMGMKSVGILETDDFNGIVWLCDEHARELREWLRNEEDEL
jgi:hypothetical protein